MPYSDPIKRKEYSRLYLRNNPEYNRNYYLSNIDKFKEKSKRWYLLNKDRARERNLWNSRKKLYNISKEDFNTLLEQQNNCCAVCKKIFLGKIDVDHNHKTRKVRGLLCPSCNKALGLLKDNLSILKNAIKYLK